MQEEVKRNTKEAESVPLSKASAAWRRIVRVVLMEAAWVGCAFLLGSGELLFGVYPLALALLCAGGDHTLSVLVGAIASAVFRGHEAAVYICVYIAAALVRFGTALLIDTPEARMELPAALRQKLKRTDAVKKTDGETATKNTDTNVKKAPFRATFQALFAENIGLRMTLAAMGALVIGIYRCAAGGFRYYDLFGALVLVLLTPIAVPIYSVCLRSPRIKSLVLLKISQGVLLFSTVWASHAIPLGYFSLPALLALFFTFCVTAADGVTLGTATAVLLGLAYAPIHIPAFVFAALLFALLKKQSREGGGLALGLLAWLSWSTYAGGIAMLVTLVPTALLAGACFTVASRFLTPAANKEEKTAPDPSAAEGWRPDLDGARYQDANERFRGISDAFSSLSEMFYNLSDRFRRPGTLDLRRICDSSFDRFCCDCPNKSVCWGLEYTATLNTVNGLISGLHTKGRVSRAHIPETLSHRCDSVDAILEQINRECAKLTGELLRNNRTEILAMDYEAAASIINDALEEDGGEYRFDPEQEQKIAEYLSDAGVRANSVTVYGKRRRQIMVRGVNIESAKVTVETLCSDLGEMCGMRLGPPTFEVEGAITTMTLQAKKKIAVVGAQNNVSADGGVSGDAINLFSNKKDYFYALINDGMGSGKEAALTSGICSVFLEKMMRAGNRASTSLQMLNNMIRSRRADSTSETSSTVDLLELDLITGEASFIKSGAAPSFVIRGRVVHRLQAGTVPIGIISALDVRATPFSLKAGDTVVMVSDGILQNDPDASRLAAYLAGCATLTPEEIVYHICLGAAENENHDDCSAIALRIQSA